MNVQIVSYLNQLRSCPRSSLQTHHPIPPSSRPSQLLLILIGLTLLLGLDRSPAFSQDPTIVECIKAVTAAGMSAPEAFAECTDQTLPEPTPQLTPHRIPGDTIPVWLDLNQLPAERRSLVAEYGRSFNFDNNLKYAESLENAILGFEIQELSRDEATLLIDQANTYSVTKLERALFPPFGLRAKIYTLFGFKYEQFDYEEIEQEDLTQTTTTGS